MVMMMMMTNDDDYDDCFLHTWSVEVYPSIVRSLFVSNYLSLEVHFPGVWNILVLRLHSHFSLSWPICNGWPTSQRFMFPGSFAWGEPGTYHICYCAYIIGLGLGELQLMMADVVNHEGGLPMSWSRVSRGGANCVEQAVTNYQGFQHELGTVRVRATQLWGSWSNNVEWVTRQDL